jgi:LPS export ABC transporter protein LptC
VPDQVIAQFHRTETHEGRLQWKLTARRADVYDDQNRIDLVEMQVDFYNEEGGEPSHLSGDRGQVNTRTHDMMAEGNVVLENPDGVVLSTTQLFWRSAEEKMRTDRHVVITQNGDVVEGRGFVGDPSLKSFEILHSVDATVSGEEVESSE